MSNLGVAKYPGHHFKELSTQNLSIKKQNKNFKAIKIKCTFVPFATSLTG